MTDTDNLDLLFFAAKQLADCLCLRLDGTSRSLFNEQITVFTVLKGKQNQIHRLFQRHNEAGHIGLGHSNGVASLDLIDPQRDNRTARTHNIAITGAADLGVARHTGFCNGNLLLHGLGHTHCIDGICSLVGRQADDTLDALLNGSSKYIISTDNIGAHGFHGEELAGGHLLQGSSMEDVVHTVHSTTHRLQVAHIADVKLDLICYLGHLCLILMTHIILLFLIAGEDADLANVGGEETVQNRIAERTGTTGNHKGLFFK